MLLQNTVRNRPFFRGFLVSVICVSNLGAVEKIRAAFVQFNHAGLPPCKNYITVFYSF